MLNLDAEDEVPNLTDLVQAPLPVDGADERACLS